jgi:tRNA(fMet)-specific endonuclease VapC
VPYVEVIDFSDDSALHDAEIRTNLKKRGALISANDLLLAAHARALRLTLVTNNTAELGDLVIENWTTPRAVRRRRSTCASTHGEGGFLELSPARSP